MKTFFTILFVLDGCMIAVLSWNMVYPAFKPEDSRLITLFVGMLGIAWFIRGQHPRIALAIVSLPLLTPLLMWLVLALIFILFSKPN